MGTFVPESGIIATPEEESVARLKLSTQRKAEEEVRRKLEEANKKLNSERKDAEPPSVSPDSNVRSARSLTGAILAATNTPRSRPLSVKASASCQENPCPSSKLA